MALRYFYLTGHYRTQLNFTLKNLKNAQNSYERLKRIILEIKDDKKTNPTYLKEFKKFMDDDLNTPNALQVLWKLIRDPKAQGKINTIKKIDEVFGLKLLEKEKIFVSKKVLELVNKREQARKDKDWDKADELRNEIQELGFKVDDTDEGTKINKL